jgi:hypothetical protein
MEDTSGEYNQRTFCQASRFYFPVSRVESQDRETLEKTYPDRNAWGREALARIRQWGFSAWSIFKTRLIRNLLRQ